MPPILLKEHSITKACVINLPKNYLGFLDRWRRLGARVVAPQGTGTFTFSLIRTKKKAKAGARAVALQGTTSPPLLRRREVLLFYLLLLCEGMIWAKSSARKQWHCRAPSHPPTPKTLCCHIGQEKEKKHQGANIPERFFKVKTQKHRQ